MSADVIGLLISISLLGFGMLPLFGLYKLGCLLFGEGADEDEPESKEAP